MVNLFKTLVQIDSISGEEKKISIYLSSFMEQLNMPLKSDRYGNLFFSGKDPKILLQAHIDTVEPGRGVRPKVRRGKIVSSGHTILGADNKAGLTVILSALKELDQKEREKIEVLFSTKEEIGLVGIRNFNIKRIKSKFGISFDKSDCKFGEYLVVGGIYAEKFTIKLIGKTSHSARPNSETNPIVLLLEIFSKLKPGYLRKSATFNIGDISGFKQLNSSPGELYIKGDVRVTNKKQAEKFYQKIETLSKKSKSKVKIVIDREVVAHNYEIPLKKMGNNVLMKTLDSLGFNPQILDRGSITEASVLSSRGIPTYLLGCGVYKTHSKDEYVYLSEMVKAKNFLLTLIKDL